MSLFSDFTDSIGKALGDILGSGGFVDDLGRSIVRPLNRAGDKIQQFVTDPAKTFSQATGVDKDRFTVNRRSLDAKNLFKNHPFKIAAGFAEGAVKPPTPPKIPKPPKTPPPLNFKRSQGGFILPNTDILAGQSLGARVGTGQLRIRRQ